MLVLKLDCLREESCFRWPPKITSKWNLSVVWLCEWFCECVHSTKEPTQHSGAKRIWLQARRVGCQNNCCKPLENETYDTILTGVSSLQLPLKQNNKKTRKIIQTVTSLEWPPSPQSCMRVKKRSLLTTHRMPHWEKIWVFIHSSIRLKNLGNQT